MKTLRKYQREAVDTAVGLYEQGKRVLIQSPCGSGKTEIAIELLRRIDRRWVFVVHTNPLVEQTEKRLREAGLQVERYGLGHGSHTARIVVATVQSLLLNDAERRLKPEAICYDEAHHYEADSWSLIAKRYPRAARFGLTATPQRRDGRSLLRHFDEPVVVAGTYAELIRSGVLVPSHVWAPTISNPLGLARDPIEAWNELSEGAQTIVAFGTIAEARVWAERFNDALAVHGIRAACVDGDTRWSYNQDTLREFREGKIQILTNVYYITEGFDLPSIGCVILARRFQFRSTYMQFVGRALRCATNKSHATIIDTTGCTWLHGVPDNDRPWSFADEEIASAGQRGDGDGTGHKRTQLRVTNEGLVCVSPMVYSKNDKQPSFPMRKKFIRDLKVEHRGVEKLKALQGEAKRKAGCKRWGIETAKRWENRERKRLIRLGVVDVPRQRKRRH